jgi:transport family protein 27
MTAEDTVAPARNLATDNDVQTTTLRSKIIVVGDKTVGKSALTQMFHSNGSHYPKNYVMTVGVDFCVKIVNIPETNIAVELYLFDAAGQSIFRDLIINYCENASAFIMVYDCTNPESFQNCSHWLELIRQLRPDKPLPGVLVANKVDLTERCEISSAEGEEFAKAHHLEFYETSALRGTNVEGPFHAIASKCHALYEEKLEIIKSASP